MLDGFPCITWAEARGQAEDEPEEPFCWLAGSPDGITASGKLLEVKCPMSRPIGDGTVPDYYLAQVAFC